MSATSCRGTSPVVDALLDPGWRADEARTPEAWAQVLDALEPVLDEHGFDHSHDNESNTGGWAYLSAEEGNGAVLSSAPRGTRS